MMVLKLDFFRFLPIFKQPTFFSVSCSYFNTTLVFALSINKFYVNIFLLLYSLIISIVMGGVAIGFFFLVFLGIQFIFYIIIKLLVFLGSRERKRLKDFNKLKDLVEKKVVLRSLEDIYKDLIRLYQAYHFNVIILSAMKDVSFFRNFSSFTFVCHCQKRFLYYSKSS